MAEFILAYPKTFGMSVPTHSDVVYFLAYLNPMGHGNFEISANFYLVPTGNWIIRAACEVLWVW